LQCVIIDGDYPSRVAATKSSLQNIIERYINGGADLVQIWSSYKEPEPIASNPIPIPPKISNSPIKRPVAALPPAPKNNKNNASMKYESVWKLPEDIDFKIRSLHAIGEALQKLSKTVDYLQKKDRSAIYEVHSSRMVMMIFVNLFALLRN
jgi:hypothetical protein